jgi:hypothetical protein
MPSIDPKSYQPKPKDEPEPVADTGMAGLLAQMAAMQQETARLLLEMRQSGTSGNAGAIEKLLEQQERLLVKTRPENAEHPGISVYSYPEGELTRPKPELKCKFIWCGQEESRDQLTPEEIDLRNKLEPGTYKVTKANGQRISFNVAAKRTDSGKLEQLTVWFPCKNEHKTDHMSNVAYLRQVLGESIPSLEELMRENARLRSEAESLRAGAV